MVAAAPAPAQDTEVFEVRGVAVDVTAETAAAAREEALAIGERMLEQTPGITRLVDRLAKKGWVRRERSPHDRRQVFCFITQEGLTLLSSLDDPVRDVDAQALGTLPDLEVRGLLRLLETVRMQPTPES